MVLYLQNGACSWKTWTIRRLELQLMSDFLTSDVLGLSENLAASAGSPPSITGLVNMWAKEVGECHLRRTRRKTPSLKLNTLATYNPNNPVYSHFTQIVWKATTDFGCHLETCNNSAIFDFSKLGVCYLSFSLPSRLIFMFHLPSQPISLFANTILKETFLGNSGM